MGFGFDDLGFYGMDITDENLGPDAFVPGNANAEEGALLAHILEEDGDEKVIEKLK